MFQQRDSTWFYTCLQRKEHSSPIPVTSRPTVRSADIGRSLALHRIDIPHRASGESISSSFALCGPASGHPTTISFLFSLQWSALYPSSGCPSTHPSGFEGHGNAAAPFDVRRGAARTWRGPRSFRTRGAGRLYIAPSTSAPSVFSRAFSSKVHDSFSLLRTSLYGLFLVECHSEKRSARR